MRVMHAILAAPILLLSTQAALADRIDGNWCSAEGKSISVDGPRVTTARGTPVDANYNRHHVDYIIPTGEPDEGNHFQADQLNDDQIRVVIVRLPGGDAKPAEIWTPCKPVS